MDKQVSTRHRIKYGFLTLAITFIAAGCMNIGLHDMLSDPASTAKDNNTGPKPHLAFVSSDITLGDFSTFTSGIYASCGPIAGIDRADCACQAMAISAHLPAPPSGEYIAWLSDSTADMSCRIQGNKTQSSCTIPEGGPQWRDPAGNLIFDGYADMFGGVPHNALKMQETGIETASSFAWTGTSTAGAVVLPANHCDNWSTAVSFLGGVGLIGAQSGQWTDATSTACDDGYYPIYCFAKP